MLTKNANGIAGSFSTQLLPELSYHLESAAGSLVTYKIDRNNKTLWDKYSPENFPVITWRSAPRACDGKDTGTIYVFPRTEDGIIKIGYRGVKVHSPSCSIYKFFTKPSLYSLRIFRRPLTVFPSLKTANGRFLYHMRTARLFHPKPRRQSEPSYPSFYQSLTRLSFTRRSCVGILTP